MADMGGQREGQLIHGEHLGIALRGEHHPVYRPDSLHQCLKTGGMKIQRRFSGQGHLPLWLLALFMHKIRTIRAYFNPLFVRWP